MAEGMDVYRTAKSPRPAWANALIVAAVLLVAAVVFTLASGFTVVTVLMYAAVGVALLVAGIQALIGLKN